MSYTKTRLLKNEKVVRDGKITPLMLLPSILKPIIITVIISLLLSLLFGSDPSVFKMMLGIVLCIFLLDVAIRLVIGIILLKNTELTLTNKRLVYKQGVFSRDTNDLPLANVNTITVKCTFWGKILNYGDLVITTSSFSAGQRIRFITHPDLFKQTVLETINALEEEKDDILRAAITKSQS